VRGIGRSLLGVVLATAASVAVEAQTPLAVHIHSEKAMFQVLISPGWVGSDDFVLQLMDGGGTLLPVKAATLVLSKPGSGAGPLVRQASLESDGYWQVDSVPILLPGRWHLRIEVETLFRKIALEDDFDLPEQ